jgi:site-specific recombinase XerD
MAAEQLSLFSEKPPGSEPSPPGPRGVLSAGAPLSLAMERFREHLIQHDYAENTVKSFMGDLRIFRRFLKGDPAIDRIGVADLQRFLLWLQHERPVPCSPKSYARRLTTLKVFFAWLKDVGARPSDPAASLVHKPVQTPMPQVLSDAQVEQVLACTREMITGQKADPRPHLLVTLLLHSGIKKQECMGIKLSHIDISKPTEPVVHIRYANPRMQHKERRLRLPGEWTTTLAHYRRVYEPQESLFPCTARNLEYVLTDLAKQAGLPDGLSFEMLRWTCAVRDYQARMDPDRLRRKLGLSMMSWRETEPKIVRLAEPPL